MTLAEQYMPEPPSKEEERRRAILLKIRNMIQAINDGNGNGTIFGKDPAISRVVGVYMSAVGRRMLKYVFVLRSDRWLMFTLQGIHVSESIENFDAKAADDYLIGNENADVLYPVVPKTR